MAQGPFPIQDPESAELTTRGSPERPHRRLRWLVVIILAIVLCIVAWSFGAGDWFSSDDPGADAGARQHGSLVASVSRSSRR